MFFGYEKQAMIHTAGVQFQSDKEEILHEIGKIWLGNTSMINEER
jgi:hypothetical protein